MISPLQALALLHPCFNPRTRKGCDISTLYTSYIGGYVSIHAPAGGATVRMPPGLCSGTVSIHAPAGGATYSNMYLAVPCVFQSTHPQGVRLPLCLIKNVSLMFQSTHPQGVRRAQICKLTPVYSVSIHAPAGGATQYG